MRPPRVEVYRTVFGWRWRLRSANGKIVDTSRGTFQQRSYAVRDADRVRHVWSFAVGEPVTVEE